MTIDQKIQEELKNKLLEEKSKIENELAKFAKPTEIPGDYATKFENVGTNIDENASEVEQYTDNLALENTLEKELKKINNALERMKQNIYGVCKNCGEEIDIKRLKVYPAAENCTRCKQKITAGK